jgi:hypothetical protein
MMFCDTLIQLATMVCQLCFNSNPAPPNTHRIAIRIQRFHRSGIASTLARLFGPAELEADGDDANFLDNLRQVVAFAVNRWITFDVFLFGFG